MATILEELRALADADGQKYIDYLISQKADLATKAAEQDAIYSVYMAAPNTDSAAAATVVPPAPPAAAAHVPSVPNATTTTQTAAASTTAASPDIAKLLSDMSAKIDSRLADLDKQFIPATKIPELRNEWMGIAIKASDDYATVREAHREEFGKPIDRAAFEKFVTDQKEAGVGYKNMVAAHDAFVAGERVAAQIAKGVEEGVKQKTSSMTVPGQTQQVAMSAAQQIMAKARADNKAGGSDNAMKAAQRLADLEHVRDNAGAVN